MSRFVRFFIVSGMIFISNCAPKTSSQPLEDDSNPAATLMPTSEVTSDPTVSSTPVPQFYSPEVKWGPNFEDYPPYINPLTGLPGGHSQPAGFAPFSLL